MKTSRKVKALSADTESCCPVCETFGLLIGLSFDKPVFQCQTCSLIYLSSSERINADHSNSWGIELANGPDEWPNELIKKNTLTFTKQLSKITSFTSSKNILDVGCGAGTFLAVGKANGWNVIGVEESPHWRKFVENKFNIPCHASLTMIEDGSQEIIRLSHVLEHIPEPIPFLKALRKKMQPNAILIVMVPNAAALPYMVLNAARKLLHQKPKIAGAVSPGFHVLAFTIESLNFALLKSGFIKEEIFSVSMGNSTYYPLLYDGLLGTKTLREYCASMRHLRHLMVCLSCNLGSAFGKGEWIVGYFRLAPSPIT